MSEIGGVFGRCCPDFTAQGYTICEHDEYQSPGFFHLTIAIEDSIDFTGEGLLNLETYTIQIAGWDFNLTFYGSIQCQHLSAVIDLDAMLLDYSSMTGSQDFDIWIGDQHNTYDNVIGALSIQLSAQTMNAMINGNIDSHTFGNNCS